MSAKGRISPVVTLLASLALVVVSFGAWLSADRQGVGLDLPQATSAGTTGLGADGAGEIAAQARPNESTRPTAASTRDAADPAARSPLPATSDIPRVDATEIQAPEPVAAPTRLVIPSLDLQMPIVATGVLPDGQMELPDNPDRVGWYRFGPAPGEDRGSVVLGGHVDSVKYGVGPLAGLAAVERGARITVLDADDQPVAYRVTSVERISKSALPVDRLFAPDVKPRLVVITCGGRYLPDAGGYEDNIVVIAKPV